MPEPTPDASAASRADTLLGFLEADGGNLQLLSDAAEAALAEGRLELAETLLERYGSLAPLTDRERNVSGLVAIRNGNPGKAAAEFSFLVQRHPQTPALQFNLAWALSMLGEHQQALDVLDQGTIEALPQAAALKVQLMHDQGAFEEAAEVAQTLLDIHPDHSGLLAATSVLAIDNEDVELARAAATRAGEHPDALTTLGILSLGDERSTVARTYFARALTMNADAPRALIGMGLADLADGHFPQAAENLERGAARFDSHIGSWIAAGWAHLLKGDKGHAETCFRRGYDLDPTFADSQGSLAVLMFLSGREDEGQRMAEVARRLDPKSLTGALAHAMSLSREGDAEKARRIIERAMTMPITSDGKTLAQAMSRFALGR